MQLFLLIKALLILVVVLLLFPVVLWSGFKTNKVVSLKERYEGLPEFKDIKPITSTSYDAARISDIENLQRALEEYKQASKTKAYPTTVDEYKLIKKYYKTSYGDLPKDLITKSDYCYAVSSDSKSYTITTVLQSTKVSKAFSGKENATESVNCTFPVGVKVICSPQQKCYQVKSP